MSDLTTLTAQILTSEKEARHIQMAFLPSSKGTGLGVSFLASDHVPLKEAVGKARAQTCRLLRLLPPSLSKEAAEALFTATAAVTPKGEAAVVLRAQVNSDEFGKDIAPDALRSHSTLYKEYV